MSEEKDTDTTTRPFADFLAEHNKGAGHRQASEALQRLVGAVVDTGRKGSVTIKVDVEPMKNGEEHTVLTTVHVAEKIPVIPPKAAVFYADGENNLRRSDPRQLTFDSLKEAPAPAAATEVKEAAAPTIKAAQ